jgi:ribosomal protein S4
MPIDYKLRTLRRLFGVGSLFRSVRQSPAAAAAAASHAGAPALPVPDIYADYPEPEEAAGMGDARTASPRSRSSTRQGGGPGGVPRAFFHGVPPRSVKNKAAAGQLNIVHLFEKQKMRLYYGAMRDGRFRRYVDEARSARFHVDAELMRLLEMRLDTTLYRTGFAQTPAQARQWICHNQVLVNGQLLNVRSARLRAGDVVSIRDRFVERALDASERAAADRDKVGAGASWLPATGAPEGMLPWLVVDRAGMAAVVVRPPSNDESRAMCRAALFPFIRDAQLSPNAAMRAYR